MSASRGRVQRETWGLESVIPLAQKWTSSPPPATGSKKSKEACEGRVIIIIFSLTWSFFKDNDLSSLAKILTFVCRSEEGCVLNEYPVLCNPQLRRSEEEFAVSHLKINGKIGKRHLLLRSLHQWVLQRARSGSEDILGFLQRSLRERISWQLQMGDVAGAALESQHCTSQQSSLTSRCSCRHKK